MKKPKMVKAWACAVVFTCGSPCVAVSDAETEKQAICDIKSRYPYDVYGNVSFGPIVRIEVPAPKERSK